MVKFSFKYKDFRSTSGFHITVHIFVCKIFIQAIFRTKKNESLYTRYTVVYDSGDIQGLMCCIHNMHVYCFYNVLVAC